eukprot:9900440-Ditylum_brightwellii.AAC.1
MSFNRGNDIAKTLTTLIKAETDDWMPTLKSLSEENGKKLKEREIANLNCNIRLNWMRQQKEGVGIMIVYTRHMPFYGKNVQIPCKIKFKQERTIKR